MFYPSDVSIQPHPGDCRKGPNGILRAMALPDDDLEQQNDRRRRAWDRDADRYDRRIGWWERRVFGEHRAWACSHAQGDVLEVAVGSGLNLPYYGDGQAVVGIDLSTAMLDLARGRAREVGRDVGLREGDAHHLPFDDASFDAVVCTYSLCNIPDIDRALSEMQRVLRPGGRLVLVDHVRSSSTPLLWLQKAIEFVSVRIDGDRMTRRPGEKVERHGFRITERERFKAGIVERLVAVKTS